ncbi:hypothetical protein AML83_07015, partial [Escherichia coli]
TINKLESLPTTSKLSPERLRLLFTWENSAPETISTIQKHRIFIVRSMRRPHHDSTTGDIAAIASAETRLL